MTGEKNAHDIVGVSPVNRIAGEPMTPHDLQNLVPLAVQGESDGPGTLDHRLFNPLAGEREKPQVKPLLLFGFELHLLALHKVGEKVFVELRRFHLRPPLGPAEEKVGKTCQELSQGPKEDVAEPQEWEEEERDSLAVEGGDGLRCDLPKDQNDQCDRERREGEGTLQVAQEGIGENRRQSGESGVHQGVPDQYGGQEIPWVGDEGGQVLGPLGPLPGEEEKPVPVECG